MRSARTADFGFAERSAQQRQIFFAQTRDPMSSAGSHWIEWRAQGRSAKAISYESSSAIQPVFAFA